MELREGGEFGGEDLTHLGEGFKEDFVLGPVNFEEGIYDFGGSFAA